ncbi:MAG: hypothetical protein IJQ60_08115 [Prevotella sp.]|nr:hypothetical protein [Prevotella sp.]
MKQFLFLSACLMMCLSCSKDDPVLMQLDGVLTDYQRYIALKDVELERLKEHLQRSVNKEERYNATMNLYRAYQDFSLDSSLVYIKQSLKLADELGEQERIIDTHLSLAFLYNYVGMHHEALEIFKEQDVTGHSDWLRRSHFYLGTNVYRNLSEYSVDEEQKEYYRRQMEICRDSAIAYAPNDVILRAERLEDSGKMQQAIALLSANLPDGLTTREAGLKYYILSEIYEKLHQRDAQVKYLAMSSVAGIKNAVREYIALRKLAVLLYEQNDIDRAYTYIHRCIDDAKACNARMRMVETSSFLSVIDSAVVKQKQDTRNALIATAAVISMLLILLVVTLIVLHRKMNLLRKSEKELMKVNNQVTNTNVQLLMANKQLKEANEQVVAANKVKEEYVTRFMNLCMEYIYKMEHYRSQLNKIANKHNFKDLYEAVKSTRYINQEVNDFYNNFDEAFLHIYPNFLKNFNALLRPEAQINPKKGERLNTELRIYALLKLGISDSQKVQEFLRCSSSTVYNYRTNMRNKAINRETFEQDVMRI